MKPYKNLQKVEEKLVKLSDIAGTGCVWKVSRFLLPEPDIGKNSGVHACAFCMAVKGLGKVGTCIRHDTVKLVAQLKKVPGPQIVVCHAGVAEVIVPIPPGTTGFTGVVMLGPFRIAESECSYPELGQEYSRLPLLSEGAKEGYFDFIPELLKEEVRLAYADTVLLPRRPHDERILQVLEFLHQHLTENPSVPLASDAVFMSASRLQHLFKQECGIGMGEYVLKLRLLRTRRYLLGSNWSIGRVAEMGGFPSQSYFGAMFRREFGMPPLRYRRKFGHSVNSV